MAAATPKMCMCPLICFHEVFGEDNFCDFCNADAVDECECAGEYFTADRSTGGAAPVPTTANPTTPASGARWTEKVEESSRSTWSGSGRERSACLGPASLDVQKDNQSTRSGSARER